MVAGAIVLAVAVVAILSLNGGGRGKSAVMPADAPLDPYAASLTLDGLAAWLADGSHIGAIAGRFANRIANAVKNALIIGSPAYPWPDGALRARQEGRRCAVERLGRAQQDVQHDRPHAGRASAAARRRA